MISIVTVNWNSYDFLYLLMESLQIYSTTKYHLIVVDNSLEKRNLDCIHIKTNQNIGHGKGLNEGVKHILDPYVMFLDVDCHILKHDWERYFIEMMGKYDVVGGRGVAQKPIRPACMFMKKEIAVSYDWADSEGYKGHRVTPNGFDVAISAYYQMVKDNVKIDLLESTPNRYGTLNGEEWCVNNVPLIYHHWHGSHLKERQVDFPKDDLLQDKNKLFASIPWRTL